MTRLFVASDSFVRGNNGATKVTVWPATRMDKDKQEFFLYICKNVIM